MEELSMPANVQTMMTRRPAWHNLGNVTGQWLNAQDAFAAAGLEWTVSKRQLEYNGMPVDAWGIFREDTEDFLGAVGRDYTPCQNVDAFAFVDAILGAAGAHYETAGALGRGQRVWCLANLHEAFTIRGTDDKHELYLLFANSHDSSLSVSIGLTETRVVCQNTLSLALRKSDALTKIRHTKSVESRLEDAKVSFKGVVKDIEELKERLNTLAERVLRREDAIAIFDRLFPQEAGASSTRRDNVIANVLALCERNDDDAFPQIRGTAYNLLNAISEYTDHERSARITARRKGYSQELARAENAMFGSGAALKQRALEVITEVTGTSPTRPLVPVYFDMHAPVNDSVLLGTAVDTTLVS
jgi:phage/plasmid-like protein (TIGR03299 family)